MINIYIRFLKINILKDNQPFKQKSQKYCVEDINYVDLRYITTIYISTQFQRGETEIQECKNLIHEGSYT